MFLEQALEFPMSANFDNFDVYALAIGVSPQNYSMLHIMGTRKLYQQNNNKCVIKIVCKNTRYKYDDQLYDTVQNVSINRRKTLEKHSP